MGHKRGGCCELQVKMAFKVAIFSVTFAGHHILAVKQGPVDSLFHELADNLE